MSLITFIIFCMVAIEKLMTAILIFESLNDRINNRYFSSIFYVVILVVGYRLTF